jgi:hypothetical protein
MLFFLALLAVSVAWVLSPPGTGVWAWYQSPVSPVSPASPLPSPSPAAPPTVVASPPPPVPETPYPAGTAQTASRNSTALLVAGGIVLVGLIAGAVVLLIRGQPPDEPES